MRTPADAPLPPPPPAEDRLSVTRWAVPWRLRDCVAVVALTAVAMIAVLVALPVLGEVVTVPEAVLLPLPLMVLGLVTVVYIAARHRGVDALTGPRRARPLDWAKGLGIGLLAFLVVNLGLGVAIQIIAGVAGFELPTPQPGLRDAAADPDLLPWLVLSAVVVAPIAEELFFRGMLFPALRSLGRWPAIGVSAVVFALAHILGEASFAAGTLTVGLIFPLGVLLAWIYERSGTIVVPIAVHAAFNGVTTLLLVGASTLG